MTALERRIGVTRVARITGLDRTGVEVACAVRPLGHVLQVSNGKGWTFATAGAGALAEAAELWAAEQVDAVALRYAARAEMVERYGEDAVWDASALGSAGGLTAPALWSQETRIAWRAAESLEGSRRVWIPAQAIHCPPASGPPLGPAVVRWSSNGMGAHRSRAAAVEHGLLEALERDRVARALPQGLTEAALRRRMLAQETLPDPLRRRVARLSRRGFAVYFLGLGGAPPCAACLLLDREGGPVGLTAGYACRREPEAALEAALLEAAQSRLTDIHGAREDVVPADPSHVAALGRWLTRAPARRRFSSWRPFRGPLARLFRRAALAELAPPGLGLHVIKVIAPDLRVSELL